MIRLQASIVDQVAHRLHRPAALDALLRIVIRRPTWRRSSVYWLRRPRAHPRGASLQMMTPMMT
eukprot:12413357-Karenia_brevis.AAC.1